MAPFPETLLGLSSTNMPSFITVNMLGGIDSSFSASIRYNSDTYTRRVYQIDYFKSAQNVSNYINISLCYLTFWYIRRRGT